MAFEITKGTYGTHATPTTLDMVAAQQAEIVGLLAPLFDSVNPTGSIRASASLFDSDESETRITVTNAAQSDTPGIGLSLGNNRLGFNIHYTRSEASAPMYIFYTARYAYNYTRLITTDENGDRIGLLLFTSTNSKSQYYSLIATFTGTNPNGDKRKCACLGSFSDAINTTYNPGAQTSYTYTFNRMCIYNAVSDATGTDFYYEWVSGMPLMQFIPLAANQTFVNPKLFIVTASPDALINTQYWTLLNGERYYKLGPILIKE